MSGNKKLDSNHDIIIGRGTTRFGGAEYVSQLTKCNLLLLHGEWQNDTSLGMHWFDGLLSKQTRESDIQVACANTIRNTWGVQGIISLEVSADFKARVVTVSFNALSVYGTYDGVVQWL